MTEDAPRKPRKSAGKTRGRPFTAGNPGKPIGTRHRVTMAMEALLGGEADKLTRKAIDLALAGDVTALRLCLDRLAPPRRDAPVTLTLPTIETAADVVSASSSVLAAVAAGEVTPDEAGRVMALLSAHRAIVETCDLEARVADLEGRM